MADLEKIVEIIFEGKDNVSTTMRSLDKRFDNFTRNVQDATAPLADLGRKATMVEGVLVAALGAGLVYAYSKSKDFESAMIDLEKVVGNQPQLLDAAKNAAYEMSDTYGESTTTIIDSTAAFVQAGFDVKEAIDLTKDSLDLMIAGDLELAEAQEYVTRTLKGFQAPASDSQRIIDSLNAVSNIYATNVQELGIGLSQLSPIAKVANMTFEQTEGVLTPVIEIFGSGSEAARGLRTGLLRIVDDVPQVVKVLEDIGVQQRDANGTMKSAYEILTEVAEAFETTEESEKLFIAQTIFGKDQAAKMVAVIDQWDKVLAVTETALNSTGSALEEVNKRLASSEVAVNRFIEGFVNLNTEIGDKFAGAATETLNGATEIENALRQIVDSGTFDPVWNALNGFFNNLAIDLREIAKNLPEAFEGVDFDSVIGAFRNLFNSVDDLFDSFMDRDLDLTQVDDLRYAIQRFIDLIAGNTNLVAGFLEGIEPIVEVAGEIASNFTKMDEKGQQLFGNILGWAQTANTAASALDGMKDALWALVAVTAVSGWGTIGATLDGIGKAATGAIGATGTAGAATGVLGLAFAFDLAYERAVEFFGLDYRGVKDSYSSLSDAMQNIIDVATGKRDWWTGDLKESADDAIGTAETLKDSWYGTVDGITNTPAKVEVDTDSAEQSLNEFSDTFYGKIQGITQDENKKIPVFVEFEPPTDTDFIELAKNAINENKIEIPVEIQKAEIEKEIAQIEQQGETLRDAFKYKAEVDVAEIEAFEKTTTTALEEVGESFREIEGTIGGLVDAWSGGIEGAFSGIKENKLWSLIQDQQEMAEQMLAAQVKLTNAQTDFLRVKTDQMEDGEPLMRITIDESVEPALRLVLMNILELMQTEFNSYADQFLIGAETIGA